MIKLKYSEKQARRNEIAMQQNPDYGQFFDAPAVNDPKRGIDLGLLGLLAGPAGFFTGSILKIKLW